MDVSSKPADGPENQGVLFTWCQSNGKDYAAVKAEVAALQHRDAVRYARLADRTHSPSPPLPARLAEDVAGRIVAAIAASSPARPTSSAPPARPEADQELAVLKELVSGVRTREELKAVLIDLLFDEILAIAQGVIEGTKRRGRNTSAKGGEINGGESGDCESEPEEAGLGEQDF